MSEKQPTHVGPLIQELMKELSRERLMEETRAISQWVRLSGTPEERATLEYVRDRLEGFGLRTEILEHDALISLPGRACVTILEPERQSLPCITHSFAASTHPAGLEGELVDVGSAPPEAYRQLPVAGKVLLADGLAMPVKVRQAEAAGAVAQIHVNDDHLHEMIVSTVWGSPSDETVGLLPKTPVVSVTRQQGQRLRELLRRGKVRVRIRAEVHTRWCTTPLLVAELRGQAEPEDFVLLSGHIDSWHYGAMDNAAANAAMMEVARVLAGRPELLRRSLRLCFWSGHSHGRYSGSAWYADTFWEELYDHCVAHVNVDSLGGAGATVLSEAICMAEARPLAALAVREVAGQAFHGKRPGRAGDQSFWGIGIPAIFMTLSEQPAGAGSATQAAFSQLTGAVSGGLGWWWHTREDTVDKVDPDHLLRDAKVYFAVVARLVASKVVPLRYSELAAEYLQQVERLEEAARGHLDLAEARRRGQRLKQALESLEALAWRDVGGGVQAPDGMGAEAGGELSDEAARMVNACLKRMGRILIPLAYCAADPFEHDPASHVPPFPLLAPIRRLWGLSPEDDEFRLVMTAARRARNRLLFTLRQALAEAESTLVRLTASKV